jgi:1-acyl-sn-glycerol-3-phosphate acyltransferase
MGPLLPDDGPRGARLRRRARGIAIETLAFVAITLLSPVLLPAAAAVDLVLWVIRRKPWMAVRLLALAWWFLAVELRGVTMLFVVGARSLFRDTPRRRRGVYRLRQSWCAGHLAGMMRLFGMTLEVEDLELAGPGPELVLIRHASIIDNALPDAVLGRAHDIGLRFVLKRELRNLPTIDIGGRWVPTNFVRRRSGDTEGELEKLRTLAIDLQPDEGILIYPEGTRCTAEKLAHAQALIAERQPEIAPLAAHLRHVLPPRLGGTLALLEDARGADVVICGHVGLDGFEYVSDIWRGGLIGTKVRVRFWRHAAESVPTEPAEMAEWLYACWQELDDWIGEQHERGGSGRGAKALSVLSAS